MKKYKNIEENYIVSISTSNGLVEITDEEYNKILNRIKNKPKAPEGYLYKLKTDLTWELVETPPQPEIETEATEQDYQNALFDLGVEIND